MKANVVVDVTGLFCPMPVIRTSEAIKNVDAGGIVEVVSDDPAIEHDLPAWCKSQGHTIESKQTDGRVYRYWVKKRGVVR